MNNSTSENNKYFPEIDGLRAIAVLSVIFFHFHIPFFNGGFIGVDVFFVISGYLITGLISKQLSNNSFSFKKFYLRRIRRLFPALLAVIIVSTVISFVLFSPIDFEKFGGSVITSIVSLSNVFFYFESGYFDSESYFKPLLHTWSLGVEEQFYLIWPLMLFLFRKKPVFIVLTLTIASFMLGFLSIDEYPDANFYLMPFRIFEFGIGALIYLIPQINISKKPTELIAIIGLFLIFYASFTFNEGTALPGFNALIPCIGAGLIIVSKNSYIVGTVLRSNLATHLGKISYSLYLVHWPIVVFYKYSIVSTHDSFSVLEIFLLLISTYICAVLLNRTIENKYRYNSKTKHHNLIFWRYISLISVVLILIASSIWINNGWTWRMKHDLNEIVSTFSSLRKDRNNKIEQLKKIPHLKSKKNMVIVGDSHANDIFLSFASESRFNYSRIPVPYRCQPTISNRLIEKGHPRLVITSEIEDEKCTNIINSILDNQQLKEADILLITARWKSWAVNKLPEFIQRLQSISNAKIVVFGPTIEYKRPLPYLINKHNKLYGLEQFVEKHEDLTRRNVSKELQILLDKINVLYVDKFKVLCGAIDNQCPIILPDGGILTWDYGHWTLETSMLFKENLKTSYPEIAEILL